MSSRKYIISIIVFLMIVCPFPAFASKDFFRMTRGEELFLEFTFLVFICDFFLCALNLALRKNLIRLICIGLTALMGVVVVFGWLASTIVGMILLVWMLLHVGMILLSRKKNADVS